MKEIKDKLIPNNVRNLSPFTLHKKRVVLFFILLLIIFTHLFHLQTPICFAATPAIINPENATMEVAGDEAVKQAGQKIVGALITPIIAVLMVIAIVCKFLVLLAANFLTAMLSPDLYNFTNETMITTGWKMVRDVCNLFFLLILLFIAFCTILQIEKYHAKKTLLTLILMALLINFSKPIAIFIFDGSQLLMNFFLNKISNYTDKISSLSKIAEIIYDGIPSMLSSTANVDIAVQYIFAIIFLFMYAVALFVMALYLLIRIIAIWLLIILSPFAFLFNAVPDFKKLSSSWWDAMFKYSYVGPAIAFFLWLSTQSYLSEFTGKITTTGDFLSMKTFIPFMAVLVFLYASIIIANKFGIQFASAITSRADKFMTGAAKKMGYQWTARPLARLTGVPQALGQVRDDWKRRGIPIPFGKGRRLWSPEKTERRAAGLAERWGVRGAYMAHLRKSMENKKHLSNDELIADGERGDAASALAAAGRGKLSTKMLNAVYGNSKNRRLFEKDGKWDPTSEYLGMMFKDSVEKGQAHVFTAFEAEKSGMTKTEAVQKRWGKLTANQLGNQNLPEAMGELDTVVSDEIGAAVGGELKTFFQGLNKNVKTQLSRQAKGENAALLDSLGVFLAPPRSVSTPTRPPVEQPRSRPPRTHADEPHDIPDFSR